MTLGEDLVGQIDWSGFSAHGQTRLMLDQDSSSFWRPLDPLSHGKHFKDSRTSSLLRTTCTGSQSRLSMWRLQPSLPSGQLTSSSRSWTSYSLLLWWLGEGPRTPGTNPLSRSARSLAASSRSPGISEGTCRGG